MNWKLPLVAAALTGWISSAYALSYTALFPSSGSTVIANGGSSGQIAPGELGYFWSKDKGHVISESFAGTGLSEVTGLDLDLEITRNALNRGATIRWDVLVNGMDVGDWVWTEADGEGAVSLSYAFAPIPATGLDTFEVAMVVANVVAPGRGSIALGMAGPNSQYTPNLTLTGLPMVAPAGGSVPIPDAGSTLGLIGLVVVGLASARRH